MAEEIRKIQQKQVEIAKKVSVQKQDKKPAKPVVFKSEGNKSNSAKGTSVEKGKKGKMQTITLKSGLTVDVAKGGSVTTKEGVISLKPSGRYTVKGKDGKTRYYAANGTELKESYFKFVESGNVVVKNSKGVAVDVNKRLATRLKSIDKELKDSEEHQGLIGKAWSGLKNTFSFGDSSDKVREQLKQEKKLLAQFNQNPQNRAKIFKQLTGLEYNNKNLQDFIDGKVKLKSEQNLADYKEGQKVAVDVVSDVASGVAAFGIYTAAVAAAPVTGGASIAVGIAAAGAVGAATKVAIKAGEAAVGGYEYNSLGSDLLMGSVNGAIAPLTAGAGGAVAKTIAVRAGVQVVKETGKQATKQVISSATKNAAKQGFARTFKANLAESVLQPNNYKLVGGTLSKRLGAYAAEGVVDGALSGGAYSGVETAKNGGSAGEILQATALGFGMGAVMGGAMTSLAHGKGVITGNKGAAGTLEDAVETSLTKNVDNVVPTPKPQGVKSTATMSNKKLQNNITDKMGKKDYEYYRKLDKEFFSDNTNLRLTSNFLDGDIENTAFLELRTQLKSISKDNPQLKNLIADLSDEGLSSKNILKYLREFNNLNKKNVNLDINTINSILRIQKSGMDSDSLLSFIKLKINNPNIKSFDLLKNYSSRYAQFSNKLNTISSNDIINEFRLLIKDAEFEGNIITRQDLKEIISNVKIEHNGFNKDELILAKFDKEMFDDMSKIIDNTPLNEFESISEYLIRIDKIRKEQNKLKETVQFEANKDVIKQNYNSSETPLNEIMLTPEELAEFNSKKDYYIKKAGDPSTKQGMGVSYDFNKEQKFLSKGLQNYERYDSRKYFAQNPEMKPYGKTGDYEYVPVIRFLDLEKSKFNTVQDLVESFPEKGGSYQANALKCCFTTPVGSNENHIISDVIIEIHPLSEMSQCHLVGGWGREVRYGGNQKFKVIDKYCKVEEADFGSGIKREVKGHIVLQELPAENNISNSTVKEVVNGINPTPKPQGAKSKQNVSNLLSKNGYIEKDGVLVPTREFKANRYSQSLSKENAAQVQKRLKEPLTKEHQEFMQKIMNSCDGKYAQYWNEHPEELILFAGTLKKSSNFGLEDITSNANVMENMIASIQNKPFGATLKAFEEYQNAYSINFFLRDLANGTITPENMHNNALHGKGADSFMKLTSKMQSHLEKSRTSSQMTLHRGDSPHVFETAVLPDGTKVNFFKDMDAILNSYDAEKANQLLNSGLSYEEIQKLAHTALRDNSNWKQELTELIEKMSKQDITIEMPGFMSASASQKKGMHFTKGSENCPQEFRGVYWNLDVPKNSKATCIDVIDPYNQQPEYEFLFQKGSKLKVKGMKLEEIEGHYYIKIDAEVV